MPSTPGDGLPIEHMNYGRFLFLKGDINEAREVWLGGRARYGLEYAYHRRNDYFIGIAFFQLARAMPGDSMDEHKKLTYANASTFFSWAAVKKRHVYDAFLEELSPKLLYQLAAIYYRYYHYPLAHETALDGLRQAREKNQPTARLHRLLTETWLKGGHYLEAMQQIDSAINEDRRLEDLPQWLARAGDIYFDLNNYEIASVVYDWVEKIWDERKTVDVYSQVLKGESLFWQGRFAEARTALEKALDHSFPHSVRPLNYEQKSWGYLRWADSFLAEGLKEKAKIAYFRAFREYPEGEPSKTAKIRWLCLGLSDVEGENLKHTRNSLTDLDGSVGAEAQELAQACAVKSYDGYDSGEFFKKVRSFANDHPDSYFLKEFYEPLKTIQKKQLSSYFEKKENGKAIAFYEENSTLFSQLAAEDRHKIFYYYLDINSLEKAKKVGNSFPKTEREKWLWALYALEEKLEPYPPQLLSPEVLPPEWKYRFFQQGKRGLPYMAVLYEAVHQNRSHDYQSLCEDLYPILARWVDYAAKDSLPSVRKVVADILPGAFLEDPYKLCGRSFLELEAKAYGTTEDYAMLWKNRLASWPMNQSVLSAIWSASEIFLKLKNLPEAQKLWQFIIEHGDPAFPEYTLAKVRQDDFPYVQGLP